MLQWAAAGSSWISYELGPSNTYNAYLDRYVSCLPTCETVTYASLGPRYPTAAMATAGMALLCIAGILSIVNVGLTFLKHRPAGLAAANVARVALSAVALAVGIIGVILVRFF
jgi:hypothetical protein